MAPVIGDFLAKCATRVAYTGIHSAAVSIFDFVRLKVGPSIDRTLRKWFMSLEISCLNVLQELLAQANIACT